jgi:four helix bundle protein
VSKINRFEDLEVFQLARKTANEIYDISSVGDFGKDFVLRDQVRRAAVSIFSNIAEGFERNGNKEFIQFLSVAKASCGEVRAQLLFAKDRAYISEDQLQSISFHLETLSRQIAGFSKYLRQSELKGFKYNLES